MKYLFSVIMVILVTFYLLEYNHKCRWESCPYKNVTPSLWKEAVLKYTGCEEGSDCYEIDMLHLEYPDKTYDELEDLLFKIDFTT